MLREKTVVLSIVFSLLSLVILPFQTCAQTSSSSPQIEKTALTSVSRITNPSAKLFLNSGTDEPEIRASLDRIEKEQYKSSNNRRQGLSSKTKTGIYIGIGAAIAVVVIIVLVSRKDNNNDAADNRRFCAILEPCTN